MAKTEKTITRKSLLVDYFGDIIGEKDHILSVTTCGDGFVSYNLSPNKKAVLTNGFLIVIGFVIQPQTCLLSGHCQ